MAIRTTGDSHKDAQKVREHEYFHYTLEEIRELRTNIERFDKAEITSKLDSIFKDLDYKLS